MAEADMGYAAVCFPVDICCDCGFNGVIQENACPGAAGVTLAVCAE